MPSSRLIPCRPLLLLPRSLPASESFPMSQFLAWGGQSTGVSALASFLPKNTQDWSPKGDLLKNWLVGSLSASVLLINIQDWFSLGLIGLISLCLFNTKMCDCQVTSVVFNSLQPMDYSPPDSSSMEFPSQEYWSGLPFPSPGKLPNPETEPVSLALAGRFFSTSASWEVPNTKKHTNKWNPNIRLKNKISYNTFEIILNKVSSFLIFFS